MELRIGILVVLTVLAIGASILLRRRPPDPPSSPSYRAIAEIDRTEFSDPATPLLVAMFGSTNCHTCPVVWEIIESAARAGVAIERIDIQEDPKRHQRYRIDGVPTTVVANADGTVRQTMFGPITREELEGLLID